VIFEWDADKAVANLRKHRVSFEEACSVFLDPLAATFREGQLVWEVAGVWRVDSSSFVVEISEFEFGHVGSFVAGYQYTLDRPGTQWSVTRVVASPCNETQPGSGDSEDP
jgi:hypothetical protein